MPLFSGVFFRYDQKNQETVEIYTLLLEISILIAMNDVYALEDVKIMPF